MAIARDTFVARTGGSGTSQTLAYTCTGSDRALVLFIEYNSGSVSGVTYNGVAMTKVDTITAYSGVLVDSWILINPSSGANNIIATFSVSGSHSMMAESYTGVGTGGSTGGCDSHNTTTWSSQTTDRTLATTTVADNSWLIVYLRSDAGSYTAGTNVSFQNNVAGIAIMGDSGAALTPAGSKNQTFTASGASNSGGILSVGISPVATATSSRKLSLLGVG
jgi:hypothetical protein